MRSDLIGGFRSESFDDGLSGGRALYSQLCFSEFEAVIWPVLLPQFNADATKLSPHQLFLALSLSKYFEVGRVFFSLVSPEEKKALIDDWHFERGRTTERCFPFSLPRRCSPPPV